MFDNSKCRPLEQAKVTCYLCECLLSASRDDKCCLNMFEVIMLIIYHENLH